MRNDIRQGMRVLHYGIYLIFYRIHEDIVDVVRVFHGAQEWQNLI
ncbi:MAG: type II toxin-antitoxin system RelE/ParE family toxin [Caulobacterales bacterium]|nr:type II toxin-antitoxin system RelE/ParE family toxin [Caulobacterales bacterium]MCA0373445.1 type II toxin-antitoxin system RelE/ParE family toxin [Pseudomonadota bacterium]